MRTVTFGEIMLRLSPPAHGRFVQTASFDACYGGGEANVAVALAQWGLEASYVTALPENELGQGAVNALRRYGVDTRHILRQGPRIGVYFIENGASERASKVIYDRAGSSAAAAKASDFDWEKILAGAGWFHFSGITPAVSPEMAGAVSDAVRTARRMGITVSCDLNYRGKMWTVEEAKAVICPLMADVSLLIANEEHIRTVLGIDTLDLPREDTNLTPEGAAEAAVRLNARYHIPYIALTQRRSLSASDNRVGGVLWREGETAASRRHLVHIVDRVGSGDAFAAGVIYGAQTGLSLADTAQFAAAACAFKHTVEGDFIVADAGEIAALAGGDGSGSVQR